MKNLLLLLFILISNSTSSQDYSAKDADVIFHTSLSSQSQQSKKKTNLKKYFEK